MEPNSSRLSQGQVNGRSIFVAHPSEHLTDSLPNGDGLIAHSFLSGLAQRGYHLHVAADQVSLQQPLPKEVSLYPLRVKAAHRALRTVEYALRMRSLYERLSLQHHFGLIVQMNPVFPGISLALLGIDTPLILGTYVARWSANLNITNDSYSGSTSKLPALRDLVVSWQQSQANALLYTAKAAFDRIPRAAELTGKLYQLPHGVDAAKFSPDSCPLPGKKSQSILFLANVVERKGIYVLTKAFERVAEALPASTLTIAGTGEALEGVRDWAQNSPYRARIQIVGAVERSDTPTIFRRHAVYCLPSFGEPFATTLLEAMASGLPVVSTNTGGTPELVCREGALVPPRDPIALAQALIEVLASEDRARSMGLHNRAYVLEHYTWDAVLDRLESIYFKVTNGDIGRPLTHVEPALMARQACDENLSTRRLSL